MTGSVHDSYREVDLSLRGVSLETRKLSGRLQQGGVKMVIFGGGYDRGYVTALGLDGASKVREFVLAGGAYLGICAGAYFACDHVQYDEGGNSEVCGERQLKLFPGVCVGPVSPVSSTHLNSFTMSMFVTTSVQNTARPPQTFHAYVNGCGAFLPYHESAISTKFSYVREMEVVARYTFLPHQPAAVVKIVLGNGGLALLSGPHLEFSAFELCDTDFDVQKDLHQLQKADYVREDVLKTVLESAGLTLRNSDDCVLPVSVSQTAAL